MKTTKRNYSQGSLHVYAEITLLPESYFSLETIDGVRLTERELKEGEEEDSEEGGGRGREGQLSFRSKEGLLASTASLSEKRERARRFIQRKGQRKGQSFP